MSKHGNSVFDNEARALEREARAAKADMERLVAQLAAQPADARAAIRERLDSERSRLEAIAARAERALEVQHADSAANRAKLERELKAQVDELKLKRKRIEASTAEAEAAYDDTHYTLESARVQAMDGIELAWASIHVSESSLSRGY